LKEHHPESDFAAANKNWLIMEDTVAKKFFVSPKMAIESSPLIPHILIFHNIQNGIKDTPLPLLCIIGTLDGTSFFF